MVIEVHVHHSSCQDFLFLHREASFCTNHVWGGINCRSRQRLMCNVVNINFQLICRSSYQISANARQEYAWIKFCPCKSVQIDDGLYLYQIQSLHLGIPDREKKAVWIPAPAPYPPNPFFVHPKCERRLVATLGSFTLVPFFPPGDWSHRMMRSVFSEWAAGLDWSHRAGLVEVAPVAARQLGGMGRSLS